MILPDSNSAHVLRIAQITDTHLYADPAGRLLGLNTQACLQQVVQLAAQKPPQLVVATGDLAHDGSAEAYRRVRQCLTHLQAPVYCLPGNHDDAEALQRCMSDDGYFSTSTVSVNGWQQIFLNSTVSGSDGGHLSERELQMLEDTLAASNGLPTLIWLHHQPVAIGSHWLDAMAIDNAPDFFRIVDRHPQIRAITWGHVHQCFDRQYKHVRLLATPSTCIQFLPDSGRFAVDFTPPGYRWFDLLENGEFLTGIERLVEIPGLVDPHARGY